MARRRNIDLSNGNKFKLKNLTNGPSKFCQAFDINTSLNGIDLCGDELFIKTKKDLDTDEEILSSPRVNIDYAGEYKDKPWRFFLKGNKFVSRSPKPKN
jgi:DNA-3-methyladenine glycosylase